ncbi:MAG: ErfK/YbiS/YcfS/YnhG family protein [Gemmatimonadetes bacterium]|nr:ErfK/YbiS/YcfS/YnhG family protein [Gemmatimonadota bacterium]
MSTLTLVAFAQVANAQNSGRTLDTSGVRARINSDSTSARGGSNWFVSLLKKIARKSDDQAPDSLANTDTAAVVNATAVVATPAPATARLFKSKKDSLAWESAQRIAEKADGYRIVVDLFNKQLRVIDRDDTLRTADVATAMNASLEYGGRVWRFETPRGVRTVRAKDKDPVWTPPEWHFAEVALEHNLKLATLERGRTVRLKDGTKLLVKGDEVGIIRPGTKEFVPMVLDEHIVFDNTLFIPPGDTKHRQIQGELGHFRLDLGNGYLLHGTPYAKSIGAAVTHGCVRLRDEDIEWLYDNVPVGTKVYIF